MQNPAPAIQTAEQPAAASPVQHVETGNLVLRNDTILGVCEAIGQDFGFNANWLRVPFAVGVLISPLAAFGIYFALGIAVLLSRLVYPRRVVAVPPAAAVPSSPSAAADNSDRELAAAA